MKSEATQFLSPCGYSAKGIEGLDERTTSYKVTRPDTPINSRLLLYKHFLKASGSDIRYSNTMSILRCGNPIYPHLTPRRMAQTLLWKVTNYVHNFPNISPDSGHSSPPLTHGSKLFLATELFPVP